MGRLWRRKSSAENVADRSTEAASEGGLKVQKEQTYSSLISGSSDSNFRGPDKYVDRNYACHISGSSIRQLMSFEMSTENEQKRRPPSIIARLMGFEGLSPPEPTHKYCHNIHIKSQHTSNENCSQIRTSKLQHQQFKDVYEVSEVTKDENQRNQSRRIATSDISEAEMTILRQRFIDAKRFATDKTFQGSKQLNDALESLQSNKDLFLKLLQEPQSQSKSVKNQHDFQRGNPSPRRRTISEESVGIQSYRDKDLSERFHRDSIRNFDSGTSQKHSSNSGNSKKWLDLATNGSAFPTKIVVLKPNIRRIQLSEPESDVLSCLSEFENSKKMHDVRVRNGEHRAEKHFSDGLRLPKKNTGESRKLAKRVTQKMRHSLHSASLDFSHYNVDGGSSYESENDSSYGSDYASFRRQYADRNRTAVSRNAGSSVNKEAMKRLSERWKITHRYQELGLTKRSTLGEMLSFPECRKESKIVILTGKGSTMDHRFYNSEDEAWPLGISSRDGWKYGQVKSLSRSTSVPASRNSRGIFESPTRHKLSNENRDLTHRMSLEDSGKAMKEMPRLNRGLKDRSRRSKSESLNYNKIQRTFGRDEYIVSQISDDPVKDEVPQEKDIIAAETSAGFIVNEIQDAQSDILDISSIPLEKENCSRSVCESEIKSLHQDELSDKTCEDYATPSNLLSVSPKSPRRSKDAELPSPMSVLGVSFLDEPSSGTECFGSLTADLQGLRMQLQLLKQESESYAEGSITVSSSEDDEEPFSVSEKRSSVAVDSLDSSYIIDGLTNIGFYDSDPYTFMAKWHSLDRPMSPAEFEKLEEKYGEQTIWSRSERRILYDLINSGLVEIFKQYRDPHPWVKHSLCPSVLSEMRDTDGLEEKLLNWLQVQITQESDEADVEKSAVKELEWYDSAHYIDRVGSEVEDLLADELIAEIFDMW